MRPGINKLIYQLTCLLKLDHGQDLVEYSLVVALIAFGTTAAMSNLAIGFQHFFTEINAAISIV